MASQIPPQLTGNIGYQATAAAIVCLVVDVVVLTARTVSKLVTKTRAGWDDWLLIPTGIFNIAICAVVLYGPPNNGLGQHEQALLLEDPNKVAIYAKSQLIFVNIYAWACTFPKLVLLVLYLRILYSRASRIATYVLMCLVVIYIITATIIDQVMCIPLEGLWNPAITTAKCIDIPAWFTYSTVPNIVLDVAVLVLPIPTLLALQLPLRDRIGLVLTFSSGGIGTLGGIARTIVNAEVNGVTDGTWTGVPLSDVALVECTLYLIAACLPGLRPLYLRTRGKGQYSQKSSYYHSDSGNHRMDESSLPIAHKSSVTNSPPGAGSTHSMNGHRPFGPGGERESYEARYVPGNSQVPLPPRGIQATHTFEVRRA